MRLPSPPGWPARVPRALLAGLALFGVMAAAALRLVSSGAQATSPARNGAPIRPAAGADPGAPGPYAAGWRNLTLADPDGGSFAALVTYPARAAGETTAPDDSGAPYPAVTFGHGFFQTPDRYQGTLEHLATWGYVVIAPASHTGLTPNHAAFAADLRQSLDWLVAESADARSWLAGMVDPAALGASGHSMGGGASLLAAAEAPAVRVVANLAAAETRPPSSAVLARIAAPMVFIVGDADRIVPPDDTAPLYDAAEPPRQLLVLAGGTHCGFQDKPFPIACDGGRDEVQLQRTRRLLSVIFELYLRRDPRWIERVWGPAAHVGDGGGVGAARVDPGVTLLPADSFAPLADGAPVRLPLQVTNSGRLAAAFSLAVTEADCPAELSADATPELAPGAAFECTVTIRRPAGAASPADATCTVRATAPDGLTAAFATIRMEGRSPSPVRLALPRLEH